MDGTAPHSQELQDILADESGDAGSCQDKIAAGYKDLRRPQHKLSAASQHQMSCDKIQAINTTAAVRNPEKADQKQVRN